MQVSEPSILKGRITARSTIVGQSSQLGLRVNTRGLKAKNRDINLPTPDAASSSFIVLVH